MLQDEIDQNLPKFENSYILTLFDLQQWSKLTFKRQNLYVFGISEQFATKKVPYRYIKQPQFFFSLSSN
jgi:hypothetical protein